MSNELYEVAFSGVIADGADPAQVRLNLGHMFKANKAKLDQLFSGNRVVIKKNIDQQTALKYQAAMKKAGAVCEVKKLGSSQAKSAPATQPVANRPAKASRQGSTQSAFDIPPAPDTDPLHITAEQISSLSATVAPVGSDVQDRKQTTPEPAVDISGLSMAPPGTDLGEINHKPEPPPPDTSGLSFQDS